MVLFPHLEFKRSIQPDIFKKLVPKTRGGALSTRMPGFSSLLRENIYSSFSRRLNATAVRGTMLVPYLFNNVMATLVLVVFVELSAGQHDILRQISLQLLILLPSIPQTAQPKHIDKCIVYYCIYRLRTRNGQYIVTKDIFLSMVEFSDTELMVFTVS